MKRNVTVLFKDAVSTTRWQLGSFAMIYDENFRHQFRNVQGNTQIFKMH